MAANDTRLTLFGARAVLGRALLLGARGRRWACAPLVRGYSPSEARELRAVASFHHPGGFAWGYVRFSQLVTNDGGTSDTVIEVNLRYPGERDRNVVSATTGLLMFGNRLSPGAPVERVRCRQTYGHRWEVFVNPVGVDAAVAVPATRCVAGGYRWNPFFTQLADPLNVRLAVSAARRPARPVVIMRLVRFQRELYDEECGADNPLRCDVGDLTSRLGTIGEAPRPFSVPNAAGRSVVGRSRSLSPQTWAPGGRCSRTATCRWRARRARWAARWWCSRRGAAPTASPAPTSRRTTTSSSTSTSGSPRGSPCEYPA